MEIKKIDATIMRENIPTYKLSKNHDINWIEIS